MVLGQKLPQQAPIEAQTPDKSEEANELFFVQSRRLAKKSLTNKKPIKGLKATKKQRTSNKQATKR